MADRNATILVIDDEPAIREFLRFVLEKAGHVMLEAENGVEALKVLHGHHADMIITDLVMPEKEGLEIISGLKSRQPDIKIVAISGAAESDMYLNIAESLGACATLKKPFTRHQVINIVSKVLSLPMFDESVRSKI